MCNKLNEMKLIMLWSIVFLNLIIVSWAENLISLSVMKWITPTLLKEHFNVSASEKTTICISKFVCCDVENWEVVKCYEVNAHK